MRHSMKILGAATLVLAAGLLVLSSGDGPRFTFDDGLDKWRAIPDSDVEVTLVPEGSGQALQASYRVEARKVAGVLREIASVKAAGVSARLKTDAPTTLVVGVAERDGSSYHHAVQTEGGKWRRVTVPFSAFTLAEGSSDENGRLDPGSVVALVVADAAGFLGSARGERRFWLDDYALVDEEALARPPSGEEGRGGPRSFTFDDSPEGWIAIPPPAGARVTVDTQAGFSAGGGGGSLRVRYRVEKNKIAGVLRPVDSVSEDGVRVVLRTDTDALLVLGAAEADGSSYQRPTPTRAGKWEQVEASFAEFTLSPGFQDENGRLDPGQIVVLVVGDSAGFTGKEAGERTFWIDSFELAGAPARVSSHEPLLFTGVPSSTGSRATVGVSYPPGKFGRGMLADAPGEQAVVPVPGLAREQGTVEMWLSPRFPLSAAREFAGILTMQSEPFILGFKTSLLLFYSSKGEVVFLLNGEPKSAIATRPLDWKPGEWHHLAASWGPEGMQLYVDGRLESRNRSRDGPGAVTGDVVVGNQAWTLNAGSFSDTVVDELRVSSSQRKAAEIAASARASRPLAADGATVALEHFDGSPRPPLTLAPGGEPFHPVAVGKGSSWAVSSPDEVPEGSRLSFRVTTPGGVTVAEDATPAGRPPLLRLPPLANPGFHQVSFALERGGSLLNRGSDWVLAHQGERRSSPAFGAAGSAIDPHDTEEFFRRAAAAGVRTVRLPFDWADIEPRDGAFEWERPDRIVGWARKHGVELVPTLFWEKPAPLWAGGGAEGEGLDQRNRPPRDLAQWADFVFRVVERYRKDVRWWIPANEPNLARYWSPKPDAKAYVALLAATARAARRADPGARILGMSVSGIDLRFLEAGFREGALASCDAVGIHAYIAPHSPDEAIPIDLFDSRSPRGTLRDGIGAVRDLIAKHGGRHGIWLDEAGQPYRQDFIIADWGVSEMDAAARLAKIYAEALATPGVERVLWFDFWGWNAGSMSLLKPDGTPTLPMAAYAAAAHHLGGNTGAREGRRGKGLRALVFSGPAGEVETVWALEGSKTITLARGERARDLFGFPVSPAADGTLAVGEAPLYVEKRR